MQSVYKHIFTVISRILPAFASLFFAGALMSSISSCSTVERFSTNIQTLASPDKIVGLPANANIAIAVSIYPDTRSDSMKMRGFPSDSVMLVKAAFALKERLEESPKYPNYDFPIYSFPRTELQQSNRRLSPENIALIADSSQAHYLISIEYLQADLWYESGRGFDDDYGAYNFLRAMVPYDAIFRIYNIATGEMLDNKVIMDTLIYETTILPSETANSALRRMPDPVDAVPAACERVAGQYADRITPRWQEEVRFYYSVNNNTDMSAAARSVRRGQWSDAIKIWSKYVDNSDTNLAAVACFNMAVGCEMMGEYELAIDWLQNAMRKNHRYYSFTYEKILQQRIEEKSVIDRAMK